MNPDWKPTRDGKAQYWVEGSDGAISFNEPLQDANVTIKVVPSGNAEMTPREQADLMTKIIIMLLPLSEAERVAVIDGVRRNGVFCAECGFGSHERPNANCQCCNDE